MAGSLTVNVTDCGGVGVSTVWSGAMAIGLPTIGRSASDSVLKTVTVSVLVRRVW